MTIEESIKNNGYAIKHSNLTDWATDSFSITNTPFLIMCTSGTAVLEVNLIKHNVRENSILSIQRESLVKIESISDDFMTIQLLSAPETLLAASAGLTFDAMQSIHINPHRVLTDEHEIAITKNLINTLEVYAKNTNHTHHIDFIYGIIRCLVIELTDIANTKISGNNNTQSRAYTTADSYFMKFVILLNQHCRQQHDVAFYADKLNITPKYLNEIVRKQINHTAKDVITKFIVASLKRELLYSGNTVQRIAYDFNFCDQSSLGKFFKKATGMSPVSFRRKPE